MESTKVYQYERTYNTKNGIKKCFCKCKKILKNSRPVITSDLIDNIKIDSNNKIKKKDIMKKYNLSLYYVNKILNI